MNREQRLERELKLVKTALGVHEHWKDTMPAFLCEKIDEALAYGKDKDAERAAVATAARHELEYLLDDIMDPDTPPWEVFGQAVEDEANEQLGREAGDARIAGEVDAAVKAVAKKLRATLDKETKA